MDATPKFSLLIVDDDSADLAVLNTILRSDYEIFTAKSGEGALKVLSEKLPDMILLDVLMPGIDGFELIKQLKEDSNTRKIPIIFITGLENDNDEAKGFALGAVDYIRKPFKAESVKARVRAHMESAAQARASERLGLIDPLTGIANRRSFDERSAMEWRRAIRDSSEISLLMIDIDKFKSYNDTYGHPQGDVLLKAVARVFEETARRPADLTARIGGEEFGILLPLTALESALNIAEDIRAGVEALRVPTADKKAVTSITVSIGAASTIPKNNDRIETFIARADKNLYTAKDGGRNRICHDG
ncbi:hypothetical protein AGMMS50268_10180 [Spirochaetia bacterium]|nr:hypothetical protein AGMMS50268_10180 [Spirochaetia bacterium]